MVNVVVMSESLNDIQYFFNPREFSEAPIVGDFIDVSTFLEGQEKELFKEKMQENNKITVGIISSRMWTFDDGKLALFVFLDFDDIEEGSKKRDTLDKLEEF